MPSQYQSTLYSVRAQNLANQQVNRYFDSRNEMSLPDFLNSDEEESCTSQIKELMRLHYETLENYAKHSIVIVP